MEVKITHSDKNGHAFIGDEVSPIGEMTFTWAGKDKIIIDHTEVGEELKGKGAGKQMLMALVEKARAEGFKIMPLYPFAHSVFRRDASIKDVWF
jgi:uncharacterized protein